jgi:hypothetical protein
VRTDPPPPDAVAVTLEDFAIEPTVERRGCCWYAASPQHLLADPQGLPQHAIDEIRTWVRSNDPNVWARRPFCVAARSREGSTVYVFAPGPDRDAPRWWPDAVRFWRPLP